MDKILLKILFLFFLFNVPIKANIHNKLDSLNILSESLIDQNLYEAKRVAQEYFELAEQSEIFESRVNSRLNFGTILDKAGDKEIAEKMLLNAVRLSNSENTMSLHINSKIELAHFYQRNSRFNDSFEYYYNARKDLDNHKNDTLLAKLDHYFGKFLIHDLKDKTEAQNYLEKSLRLYKKIKDNDNIVVSMFAIAELYRVSGMLEDYKRMLDTSMIFVNRSPKKYYTAWLNRYYGMHYMALKQFEKALPYLETSLRLNKELNNHKQEADVYTLISFCYTKLGRVKEANDYNITALNIRKEYGDKGFIASSLINLALTHYRQGYCKKAVEYAKNGLGIASSIDHKLYIMRAYKALTLCSEQMNDYKKAYEYNKLQNAYSDSLLTYNLQKRVSVLETKHKITLKDNEIRENKRLSSTRNNYQLLALFLVFVILVVMYLKYKKKRAANSKLKEKNDKIIEQNLELIALNSELEKLVKARDKVNSVISHDLVNPLRWIKNFSLTLHDNFEIMSPKDIKSALMSFFSSSQQIHSMAENLVNWGKMQSSGLVFSPSNIDLSRLIKDSASQIEVLAKEKDISIQYDLQSNMLINADPILMQLVVRNLLTNAIKFSRNSAEVVITGLIEENKTVLSIKDSGVGMEQKVIDTLFDDPITTIGSNRECGTGLGLVICKDIIDLHKGEILVYSQSGIGSKFTVKLPLN